MVLLDWPPPDHLGIGRKSRQFHQRKHPAEILALGPSCASHRRSSNTNSLCGRNSAGSPEICATFSKGYFATTFLSSSQRSRKSGHRRCRSTRRRRQCRRRGRCRRGRGSTRCQWLAQRRCRPSHEGLAVSHAYDQHQRLGPDGRHCLHDRWKPPIQLEEEQAIAVRELDSTTHLG
jgi:hypothetical protein